MATNPLTTITIILPLPPAELNPNAAPHLMTKRRAARKYKEFAWGVTLEMLGRRPAPKWKRATQQATFYHAAIRQRDGDNANASLKHATDGIACAGIVENDSGITHLPAVFKIDRENPRVEIVVTEEADDG